MNVKTFEAISKHLKIEKERIMIYAPPSVAIVAKVSGPRIKRPYHGQKPKKGPHPPQNSCSNGCTAKKYKAKGNGAKDMTRVKYNKCGKKGHFARDCPKLAKVPLSSKTPELYVYSHAFITNCLL